MERIFTHINLEQSHFEQELKKNIFSEPIGIEKCPFHYWTSTGSQLAINSTQQIKTTLKYLPI